MAQGSRRMLLSAAMLVLAVVMASCNSGVSAASARQLLQASPAPAPKPTLPVGRFLRWVTLYVLKAPATLPRLVQLEDQITQNCTSFLIGGFTGFEDKDAVDVSDAKYTKILEFKGWKELADYNACVAGQPGRSESTSLLLGRYRFVTAAATSLKGAAYLHVKGVNFTRSVNSITWTKATTDLLTSVKCLTTGYEVGTLFDLTLTPPVAAVEVSAFANANAAAGYVAYRKGNTRVGVLPAYDAITKQESVALTVAFKPSWRK